MTRLVSAQPYTILYPASCIPTCIKPLIYRSQPILFTPQFQFRIPVPTNKLGEKHSHASLHMDEWLAAKGETWEEVANSLFETTCRSGVEYWLGDFVMHAWKVKRGDIWGGEELVASLLPRRLKFKDVRLRDAGGTCSFTKSASCKKPIESRKVERRISKVFLLHLGFLFICMSICVPRSRHDFVVIAVHVWDNVNVAFWIEEVD